MGLALLDLALERAGGVTGAGGVPGGLDSVLEVVTLDFSDPGLLKSECGWCVRTGDIGDNTLRAFASALLPVIVVLLDVVLVVPLSAAGGW